MKTLLLLLLFVAPASPALADPHRAGRAESAITCDTVRAYVSQGGRRRRESDGVIQTGCRPLCRSLAQTKLKNTVR